MTELWNTTASYLLRYETSGPDSTWPKCVYYDIRQWVHLSTIGGQGAQIRVLRVNLDLQVDKVKLVLWIFRVSKAMRLPGPAYQAESDALHIRLGYVSAVKSTGMASVPSLYPLFQIYT